MQRRQFYAPEAPRVIPNRKTRARRSLRRLSALLMLSAVIYALR